MLLFPTAQVYGSHFTRLMQNENIIYTVNIPNFTTDTRIRIKLDAQATLKIIAPIKN